MLYKKKSLISSYQLFFYDFKKNRLNKIKNKYKDSYTNLFKIRVIRFAPSYNKITVLRSRQYNKKHREQYAFKKYKILITLFFNDLTALNTNLIESFLFYSNRATSSFNSLKKKTINYTF